MQLPDKKQKSQFVQTDISVHEQWAELSRRSPLASQILHLFTARVGEHNAVVISHNALAELTKSSRRGVQKALKILQEGFWIEQRHIGNSASTLAYVINSRVAWTQDRAGLRYSLFSATVMVLDSEQPDKDSLGKQAALRRMPSMFPDEQQLPSGEGLPPPSQPALPSLEMQLPYIPMQEEPVRLKRFDPYTGQPLPLYDPETGELLEH